MESQVDFFSVHHAMKATATSESHQPESHQPAVEYDVLHMPPSGPESQHEWAQIVVCGGPVLHTLPVIDAAEGPPDPLEVARVPLVNWPLKEHNYCYMATNMETRRVMSGAITLYADEDGQQVRYVASYYCTARHGMWRRDMVEDTLEIWFNCRTGQGKCHLTILKKFDWDGGWSGFDDQGQHIVLKHLSSVARCPPSPWRLVGPDISDL